MPKLIPIVEGYGEVSAVPVLLRKILWANHCYDIQIAPPENAHGKSNLIQKDGLEKFIKLAWKEDDCGAILILIDADDECPVDLAKAFSSRVKAMGSLFPVVIIVAKRMYETWFLASITTIAGHLDIPAGLQAPPDSESIKNPKDWLNKQFPKGRIYKETQEQEAMTNLLDLNVMSTTRSFQRLLKAVNETVTAIHGNNKIVTP